jgi:hypothetical protein
MGYIAAGEIPPSWRHAGSVAPPRRPRLVPRLPVRAVAAPHDRAARRHPLDEGCGGAVDVGHPVQVEFDPDRIAEKRRRACVFQPPEVARGQSAAHVDMQTFAVPGDADSCHDTDGASNRVPVPQSILPERSTVGCARWSRKPHRTVKTALCGYLAAWNRTLDAEPLHLRVEGGRLEAQ